MSTAQNQQSEVRSQKSEASRSKPIKILALCDSPVCGTGFGRVAKNILSWWTQWGKDPAPVGDPIKGLTVDCWAIHFDGWHYDRVPFKLLPGGGNDWGSAGRLSQFLNVLAQGDYTHVWMMMDPDALSVHGFPKKLREVCQHYGIKVMLYYPVDAPLEREWLDILQAVDVAVTYTEYGVHQTRAALGQSLYPVHILPHGVDEVFTPLTVEERAQARNIELRLPPALGFTAGKAGQEETIQFCNENTFLMLNVNKNEWRKDPLRSLEILFGLRVAGVPAKLILRMDPTSAMGGVQLDMAAAQLGLAYGVDYCHIGPVPDEGLRALYGAADLYLTTSLGEGWGLGVTEALACHCPVAMAAHTSLREIGEAAVAGETSNFKLQHPEKFQESTSKGGPVIWLPMESGRVMGNDTRIRHRVDLNGAVDVIAEAYRTGRVGKGLRGAPAAGTLKSWDHLAGRMLGLLLSAK